MKVKKLSYHLRHLFQSRDRKEKPRFSRLIYLSGVVFNRSHDKGPRFNRRRRKNNYAFAYEAWQSKFAVMVDIINELLFATPEYAADLGKLIQLRLSESKIPKPPSWPNLLVHMNASLALRLPECC